MARIDWRAWLALGRVSNLPTVWTNLLVGLGVACALSGRDGVALTQDYAVVLMSAWPVWIAVSLFYIAGMVLNDVCDIDVDRQERAQRPLPSGRVLWRNAVGFVVFAFSSGLALLCVGGVHTFLFGFALVCTIAAYNLCHTASGTSVVLMGLCRGWVYLLAMVWVLGVNAPVWPAWLLPLVMTLYTVMITIAARGEASDLPGWQRAGRLVSCVMLLVPVGLVAGYHTTWGAGVWVWVAAGAVALWLSRSLWCLMRRPPQIGRAVEGYLAGFCLIDAVVLFHAGLPVGAVVACGLFCVTLLAHRWIKGT